MSNHPQSLSESLSKSILNYVPMGILQIDTAGMVISINEKALQILECEKEEVQGKLYRNLDWSHCLENEQRVTIDELPIFQTLKHEHQVTAFVHGIAIDGKIKWVSETTAPTYDENEILTGCISCFSDVSETTRFSKNSWTERQSKGSIKSVFWERSLTENRVTYTGSEMEEMLGYPLEQVSIEGFWASKIHPEDREWAVSFHQAHVQKGVNHEFEYRFRRATGEYIWIRDIVDVVIKEGKPILMKGLMVDISKERYISKKLKESQDLYKLLAENTSDLVTLHELNYTFKFISPSVIENLGYTENELRLHSIRSLFHQNDYARIKVAFQAAVDGKSNIVRYRIKHKNGEFIWFESALNPVHEGDDKPRYIKNTARLIHKQKVAEDLLAESEERYRSLITKAPFSISIYNLDGILINANPAFEQVWDLKIEGLLGKFNLKKEKRFKTKVFQEKMPRAFKGERGDFISQFQTVEGRIKDLHISYFPLTNSNNEVYNVIFVTDDITARLDAERNALEGESMKQSILDSLEDALLVVDKEGQILSINQRLQNYLTRSPYPMAEIGGDVFAFLNFFEEKEIMKNGLENVLNRSSTFFDYEVKLADRKWYNLKVTQLKNPHGAVISWQNINTRKEIEIALEKSLKKYRNIYNRAPVMMHSINAKAEIMSVSDFWLEKMGYERKEVIGKKIIEFLAEEFLDDMRRNLDEFFEKGYLRNEHYLFKTKEGEILEVLLSATSEYDEEGNFERSLTGMIDITELRQTERALKRSQRNLMDAQRISKIGNYELDLRDYSFHPSPELVAMLGLHAHGEQFGVIDDIIYPDDRAEFIEKLDHCVASGADFFHVYRIVHLRNNKLKWISGRGKIVSNHEGQYEKMIGTFQDISEQRVAEEKIQRLSDRILLATELAEIGVWEYSEETQEVYWDKNMYEIFETLKEPIRGFKGLSKFIVQEELPRFWEMVEKIKSGFRFVESDLKIKTESGVRYLKTHTRVIRGENNKISRILGVLHDNTEDKMLQLELESSLEEKNILLKEVHHRVKNNMQLVSSILALKSYDLKDEESKSIFNEVNERIKSMAVIHDQLYKFYNVSEINISVYLNHIAGELRVLLGSEKANILVEADDKQFDVDKMLLFGLIVSELVSNAYKHSLKDINEGTIQIIFNTREDDRDYLAVLNNGHTIPPDIFEKKSTGLGISLIKTFSKQLNGKLSLHAKNGIVIEF